MERSPHPLPESKIDIEEKKKKSPCREERDRLLALSAGGEGAVWTNEEKEMERREKGKSGKRREGCLPLWD